MEKHKPCHIFLVRHGQTVWNTEHRMQGHQDSPLTKKGIEQAQQTAKLLGDIHFDAVYSSDSGRAVSTAEIIGNHPLDAIQTTRKLRETALGPYEGRVVEEFLESMKTKLLHRDSLPHEKQMTYKMHPEVESYQETADRIMPLLKKIAKKYQGKNVLVVSHAGSIRAVLVSIGYARSDQFPHGGIANTSFAEIESDGKEFNVLQTEGITINSK